jgi:hypothetical protein
MGESKSFHLAINECAMYSMVLFSTVKLLSRNKDYVSKNIAWTKGNRENRME